MNNDNERAPKLERGNQYVSQGGMNRVYKFFRLSGPERGLFLEAMLWLGLARLVVFIIPFRWIVRVLGQPQTESPKTVAPEYLELLRKIGREVRRAAHHTPWESRCLTQSISAKMMLKRRGFSSTLYLGVAKKNERQMDAHAWLRCGNLILTGRQGIRQFKVISTFAEKTGYNK